MNEIAGPWDPKKNCEQPGQPWRINVCKRTNTAAELKVALTVAAVF